MRDVLPEFVSGDLDEVTQRGAEAHLAGCYRCREERDQYYVTLDACRKALRHPLPLEQWAELRSQLRQETPEVFPLWRRAARRRAVAAAFAAAAVIVLAFWRAVAPAPGAAESDSASNESLAPSGFVATSDPASPDSPFRRYAATVTYYYESLDLNAEPSRASQTESPASSEDKKKLETSDALIDSGQTGHWHA
jgi:anti-sigma factor RsiW